MFPLSWITSGCILSFLCLLFHWKHRSEVKAARLCRTLMQLWIACQAPLSMEFSRDGKTIHLQCRRPRFNLWVGKIPWRRKRLPSPIFWPREIHGLYSPWGCKESDRTEQLCLHLDWAEQTLSSTWEVALLNQFLFASQLSKRQGHFLKASFQ